MNKMVVMLYIKLYMVLSIITTICFLKVNSRLLLVVVFLLLFSLHCVNSFVSTLLFIDDEYVG